MEQDRPDVLKRRHAWFDGQLDLDPGRLIFIDETGLPPYSPDFNPIENAFSKLKAMLRARAERKIDALWDVVSALVPMFKPPECANYFRAAGYDPD